MAGGVSQKRLFEGGQKGVFGLYSALQNLNQKIRLSGGKIENFSDVVRMKGLEPSRLATLAPKASVSTNSTTSACE